MVRFREHNFQPTLCRQNFRRDFSSQLASERFRITLKLRRFALGEALRVTLKLRRCALGEALRVITLKLRRCALGEALRVTLKLRRCALGEALRVTSQARKELSGNWTPAVNRQPWLPPGNS